MRQKATEVAAASSEELKTFIPKSRFDEVNTEKKNLEATKTTLEGQLETLKTSKGDVEALKLQIETLQTEKGQKMKRCGTATKSYFDYVPFL